MRRISMNLGLGLIYGLCNVMPSLIYLAFGTYIEEAVWRGTILHLPLLITSIYALVPITRAPRKEEHSPLTLSFTLFSVNAAILSAPSRLKRSWGLSLYMHTCIHTHDAV